MAEYKKRPVGGKRFPSSRPSFGARPGKPSFGKKSWGDNRGSGGPVERFEATCTKCGASCDVPFKPVHGKPVFCRDCFVKTSDMGPARTEGRYPKREYQPRSYASSAPASDNSAEILKQLATLNVKIDRLIRAVEASSSEE